ncbi:MAG TPA: hypothetical protein VNM90_22745 [Haliangium sp.]|nr:hypothetical protein [Haliangium sp.]
MRLWMCPMLAVALACTGSRDATAPARPPADAAAEPEPPQPPPPVDTGPLELDHLVADPGDEAEALRRLGAVPAWQAVVERGRYLARRGQQGVVFGRVGGPVAEPSSSHRWLVDETEGEGALAIRLAFDPLVAVAQGQRVVAWGAWHLDAERRWYWHAERLALLPAAEGSPTTDVERLVIPVIDQAPRSAVPVSRLEGDGEILFEVRGSPRHFTDGRTIADPGDIRAAARLLLPGEQPSYGGQEYRAPDERWQLARDTIYTVAVRRLRRQPADGLPILQARGVPRRVDQAALRARARLQPAQQGAEQGP